MNGSLKQLKLIESLGNGDWDLIKQSIIDTLESAQKQPYGSPLHLTVSLTSEDLVKQVVQEFCYDFTKKEPKEHRNWLLIQNIDGETVLHICARLEKIDTLSLLESTGLIDETIRNHRNQLAQDISKSSNTTLKFKAMKQDFINKLKDQLETLAESHNHAQLIQLFESQRAKSFLENGWLDINEPLRQDEQTLLHLAAKNNNDQMVEWALKNGADVNVKDIKSKKPIEYAPKKSFIKQLLKKAVTQTSVLTTNLTTERPPHYQGDLQKWTNFAAGYKQRYFVLENGVLSYYKSGEYPWSCRGSISMKSASVVFPESNDKSRFDIVGQDHSIKYSLKAKTPTEAKKWTWALMEARKWIESPRPVIDHASSQISIQSIESDNLEDLIQTEFKYQKEQLGQLKPNKIADSVIESVEKCEEIVSKLIKDFVAREAELSSKLSAESEVARRWQELVKKVVGTESECEEEFFDANEQIDPVNSANFIEQVFGFESFDQVTTRKSINAQPVSVGSRQFVALDQIEKFGVLKPSRIKLPLDPSRGKPSLNVWSFLKSAIGKDLSKVTLPVFFNEPLSLLQRMAEDIEYIELLSTASMIGRGTTKFEFLKTTQDQFVNDSLRLLFVSAFAISNYSSTTGRTSKPFNPLLGETFEFVDSDKKYRYISEQVCHHPPISACCCESPDFSFWSEVYVKSKFWGKSLEIQPLGNCHVTLPTAQGSEHFSWKKVTTSVHNLIVGNLNIDHSGEMQVKNWSTGQVCSIEFKPVASGAWFGWKQEKPQETLSGFLLDSNGTKLWKLQGSWQQQLTAYRLFESTSVPSEICLWNRHDQPPNASQFFNFTNFAMHLNEINSELSLKLPLTDSRLRRDQKEMENGNWQQATEAKETLENEQRKRRQSLIEEYRKTLVANGPPNVKEIEIGEEWWTPRWFTRKVEPDTGEEHWAFTGDYWKYRETSEWPEWVPKLYNK